MSASELSDPYVDWDNLHCAYCGITQKDQLSFQGHLGGKPHIRAKQRHQQAEFQRRETENSQVRETKMEFANRETLHDPKFFLLQIITGRYVHELPSDYSERVERQKRGRVSPPDRHPGQSLRGHSEDRSQYRQGRDGYYCKTCGKTLLSRALLEIHLSSQEHRRRTKAVEEFKCDLCLVDMTSKESLMSHLQGSLHLKRELNLEKRLREAKDEGAAGKNPKKDCWSGCCVPILCDDPFSEEWEAWWLLV